MNHRQHRFDSHFPCPRPKGPLEFRKTRVDLPKKKSSDGRKNIQQHGQYVADIRANAIYDLAGKRLYHLRGQKIYKPTGELVGHLNSVGGDRRLDKSTDRLFGKV
jgi:hypothetical protein